MGNAQAAPARAAGDAQAAPAREAGDGSGEQPAAGPVLYALRPPTQTKASLESLSIKELKGRLRAVDASEQAVAACLEKADLVSLLFALLGGGAETCAICLSDDILGVLMPCCGTQGSTISYCRRCLEIICERADHGAPGVGQCPTCRKAFTVDSRGRVDNTVLTGKCLMCRQQKELISRGLCDACVVGDSHALRFECDRCHATQRIPHPMWRYQASPGEFGTATWACHQRCGDYTHWRVDKDDAHRVPDADCPPGWGRREVWLQTIRDARMLEMAEEAASAGGAGAGS